MNVRTRKKADYLGAVKSLRQIIRNKGEWNLTHIQEDFHLGKGGYKAEDIEGLAKSVLSDEAVAEEIRQMAREYQAKMKKKASENKAKDAQPISATKLNFIPFDSPIKQYSDRELVEELRGRGWQVKCTKQTIVEL